MDTRTPATKCLISKSSPCTSVCDRGEPDTSRNQSGYNSDGMSQRELLALVLDVPDVLSLLPQLA